VTQEFLDRWSRSLGFAGGGGVGAAVVSWPSLDLSEEYHIRHCRTTAHENTMLRERSVFSF
jgi:hypothetical protein